MIGKKDVAHFVCLFFGLFSCVFKFIFPTIQKRCDTSVSCKRYTFINFFLHPLCVQMLLHVGVCVYDRRLVSVVQTPERDDGGGEEAGSPEGVGQSPERGSQAASDGAARGPSDPEVSGGHITQNAFLRNPSPRRKEYCCSLILICTCAETLRLKNNEQTCKCVLFL